MASTTSVGRGHVREGMGMRRSLLGLQGKKTSKIISTEPVDSQEPQGTKGIPLVETEGMKA